VYEVLHAYAYLDSFDPDYDSLYGNTQTIEADQENCTVWKAVILGRNVLEVNRDFYLDF
jgi:hypothetical protein